MKGLRLKELRAKANVSQADVALRLQVARATYARYETGDREMPYAALILLADYFEVSIDYLLGRYSTNPVPLSEEERTLLGRYRALDPRGRQSVQAITAHEYAQAEEPKKKPAV